MWHANIRRFARESDRATGEAWVQASTSSIRWWVREAAAHVAEGDPQADRWCQLSSHDLLRSWTTHHLVERQVDVRTMMAVGWSDYSAVEPYLAEPTEAHIGDAIRG